MPAINPAGLYGFSRGMTDAEKSAQEAQAFQSDQAIRAERLKQEQEQAPLRNQALNLEIQGAGDRLATQRRMAPLQEGAAALNLKTATTNSEAAQQQKDANEKYQKWSTGLSDGYQKFIVTGDPQHVADSFAKLDPAFEGTTAAWNADNSITLSTPNGKKPVTFKDQTWQDGSPMSPQQAMKIFLRHEILDPLQSASKEYEDRMKLQGEKIKGESAATVQGLRNDGAAARGAASEDRRASAEMVRERQGVLPVVKEIMKNDTSGFMAGFSSNDDKYIEGKVLARADELVLGGLKNKEAAQQAYEETGKKFDYVKTQALGAASRLAKTVDIKDQKAIDAAAAAGNKDAVLVQRAMKVIEAEFGTRAAGYLRSQVAMAKKR